MKLYREVLIESAEQAEALPDETVAYRERDGKNSGLCVRQARRGWESFPWRGAHGGLSNNLLIGWTALVPIEAEEETRERAHHLGTLTAYGAEFDDRTGQPVAWETRYTTPWEEA